jgi:beta-glucosidase-like glycosyl hydrolase
MRIIKKIFKFLGCGLLSNNVLLLLVFGYPSYNPKPKLIRLERKPMTDAQIDQKARELVDQMSTKEKVQVMSPWLKGTWHWYAEMLGDGMRYNQKFYPTGGNERLGIPTMRFFDGPRGMVGGKATCFPVSIGRAASFDRTLEFRIGEAIGKEIRANGGNYFGGVCINLLRHPLEGKLRNHTGRIPSC